jgi:hypothetical protein
VSRLPLVRVMVECEVCGQNVPRDHGRIIFHLARGVFTGEFRVCPGSENKPRVKKRAHICGPCSRGNHLLCDDCECTKCSKLDLPVSLTRDHSLHLVPRVPSSVD